jgi:hypothetical protein
MEIDFGVDWLEQCWGDKLARMQISRANRIRIVVYGSLSLVILAMATLAVLAVVMPGVSYSGPLPALTSEQKAQAGRLRSHVDSLCASGAWPRSWMATTRYVAARDYLMSEIRAQGLEPKLEDVRTSDETFHNIWVEIPGQTRPDEIIVVGGHYDTVMSTPGADDNASGTAGTLEVMRHLKDAKLDRTLVFYLFANEEPPHFATERMGSHVAANRDWGDREVVAMLSLEMIGYFDDSPGSQKYPSPLDRIYPDTGNFIAFVTTIEHRGLVTDVVEAWRADVPFPSDGIAGPRFIPGIDYSDHAPFIDAGIPALMITDTAFNRNENYHKGTDTPDTLDYDRMSLVVDGVVTVVRHLADAPNEQ